MSKREAFSNNYRTPRLKNQKRVPTEASKSSNLVNKMSSSPSLLDLPLDIIRLGIIPLLNVKEHMRARSASKLLKSICDCMYSWPTLVDVRDPPDDFFQFQARMTKSVHIILSRGPEHQNFVQLRFLSLEAFSMTYYCDYIDRFPPYVDWICYTSKTSLRRLALYSTGTVGRLLADSCDQMSLLSHLTLHENDMILACDVVRMLEKLNGLQHLRLLLTTSETGFFENKVNEHVLKAINPDNAPVLKSLSIPYCVDVADRELIPLFTDVHWKTLVHVDISSSMITDVFLEAVSVSLCDIKCLLLGRCKGITSRGIEKLLPTARLELLDIRDCSGVSNECLSCLEQMKSKGSLRIVLCQGTGITESSSFLNFDIGNYYGCLSETNTVRLCQGCTETF